MSAGLKITTTCFTSGQYAFTFLPNSSAMAAFPFSKSSRVIPALRAAPPEDTTYLAPVRASLMSEVKVRFSPSKPQWNISSATPSKPGAYGSYRQMFGVRRIMMAVWAMLEPIIPAAPTIVNFSFVRNSIILLFKGE